MILKFSFYRNLLESKTASRDPEGTLEVMELGLPCTQKYPLLNLCKGHSGPVCLLGTIHMVLSLVKNQPFCWFNLKVGY